MVPATRTALSAAGNRRILLVAPQPFYVARGTPMNVLQMCRVLTHAGYEVDLATYPLGEDVSLPGLRIHRAPRVPGIRSVPIGFSIRKLVLDLSLGVLLASLLLRKRYALIHAVEESAFLALLFTWGRTPVLYDLDSVISDQLRYTGVLRSPRLVALVRGLERWALGRARAALTVCEALTEAVRELCPGKMIFQVEDAPLPESLREPDAERVGELRRQYKVEGRPTAVYTGNLESYQGIDLLLAAVPHVRRRVPDVAVVIVGGEPADVERLHRRVAEVALGGALVVVGKRPPAEMPEWMALADVLVSPRCEGENTPLKIYTYMNANRVIVATALRTHTQALDTSSAVLCEPTPEGLGEALAQALLDREESAARARRARRLVHDLYGPEAFARKLCAAYAWALGSPVDPGERSC